MTLLRGIYIATAQLRAQSFRLETLAANLTQVETPGYRQDRLTEQTFARLLLDRIDQGEETVGPLELGPIFSRPTIDLSAGPVEATDRPLDVAILGPGFFVVQSPAGPRYTRRGTFRQDETGRLVSLEGWPVLGQNGPIAAAGPLRIMSTGQVLANDQPVGQLQVVTFAEGTTFTRHGGTYLTPEGGAPRPVAAPQLLPGHVEGSNVDLTTTMTDLIAAARSYQAAQRALLAHDAILARLIQQAGER